MSSKHHSSATFCTTMVNKYTGIWSTVVEKYSDPGLLCRKWPETPTTSKEAKSKFSLILHYFSLADNFRHQKWRSLWAKDQIQWCNLPSLIPYTDANVNRLLRIELSIIPEPGSILLPPASQTVCEVLRRVLQLHWALNFTQHRPT